MTSHQDRSLGRPASVRDYEHEAEHTRRRLAENLDELSDRLTPGQVFDEVLTYSRAGGGTFYRALSAAMRENPMPSLLIGAGCMMFLSDKMGLRSGSLSGAFRVRSTETRKGANGDGVGAARAAASRVSEASGRVSEAAGRVSDAAGRMTNSAASSAQETAASFAAGVQQTTQTAATQASGAASAVSETIRRTGAAASDTISGATSAVSDTVRQTAAAMTDRLSGAADSVRATAHDLRDHTSDAVEQARRGAMDAAEAMRDRASSMRGRLADTSIGARRAASSFITEQPLVSAAIGVAIGAAIASLLPRTETEDELLGDASDRMKGAAGDIAGETLESAKSVGAKVAERAQSAAREEGFSPSSVADAARNLGEGIHKGVVREPVSGDAPQELTEEELIDVKRTWP